VPVTRDPRYIDICAKVNCKNIKIGKAVNFETRQKNYFSDFDEENVIFEPLLKLTDVRTAERLVIRKLKEFQKLSPKGGRLEWLEGISYEDVKEAIFTAIGESGLEYEKF